jgi:hypothetical protein
LFAFGGLFDSNPALSSLRDRIVFRAVFMPLVRIVARNNGAGLSRDMRLVQDTLRLDGFDTELIGFDDHRLKTWWQQKQLECRRIRADVQIFIERVYARTLPLARRNLLIPNPEWFKAEWKPVLSAFDRILCKSREAVEVFSGLGCRAEHIAFTSDDRYDAGVKREPTFFHLAGRSSAKGTSLLTDIWSCHPEWPPLTIVQSPKKAKPIAAPNIDYRLGYKDDRELRALQNRHAFHLCPSEAEGFGHYIAEGMSVKAVVLTTDGAPMNELIQPDRGVLVAAQSSLPDNLGIRYRANPEMLESAIESMMRMPEAEREGKGEAARDFYLDQQKYFRGRLTEVVHETMSDAT